MDEGRRILSVDVLHFLDLVRIAVAAGDAARIGPAKDVAFVFAALDPGFQNSVGRMDRSGLDQIILLRIVAAGDAAHVLNALDLR